MRQEYVEAVLEVVSLIPPGRVLAYGDIAELLGAGGPRQVGYVLSHYGNSVPWWRVVRASGEPPSCHGGEAGHYYRREETPLRNGRTAPDKLDMASARWRPADSEWLAVDLIAAKLSEPHDEVIS